ncbi:carboxy terminal-processing peptidase [Niveibacterium terrae]|uniref:carboxy terminal-processing peptidase n=1 Tax=Niveibacterium terrae TaxID=3373598 RepID=UPI003A9441EC
MSKKSLWILIAWLIAAQAFAFDSQNLSSPLSPQPQQSEAALLSAQILSRYHYKPQPLDDAMSAKIFDRYLQSLDRERSFFTQADIDSFAAARTRLDDAILRQDLRIPFAIFARYQQRITEQLSYARELLKQTPDFTIQESYFYAREKAPWAKSEDEIRDLWRRRVKNDWLRLKLAGKTDAAIRTTLDKRYENTLNRVAKFKSEDVFQIFMNAYAMTMDPHTSYMDPRAAEDFDIAMRLSLVGIGAVLQERDEYTTIRELVTGGPAARSGKLKVGDRIVGVAQGAGEPFTDVLGWRLDDVVKLIRGAKDSVVALDILPAEAGPDGKHRTVSLVRKKISMEEQSAKKSVIEVHDGKLTRRIGVITLPTFYEDFEARSKGDTNFKSAARDVARLLGELKKDKAEAVLIDLRNNGGGSLSAAIELTGLFIDKGPVVQQRNSQGEVRVENDTQAGYAWSGPMAVLINRASASASEIFAAAIQDYGRGLVLGETSYGKGTVQNVARLNEIIHQEKPALGELKMTIAQFFRINGGTTQLRGVTPDIALPSASDPEEFGESSADNALPWTQIPAAKYSPAGHPEALLPVLRARHDARTARDKDYQYLVEDIARFSAERKKKQISLNEAERRAERDAQEARIKARKSGKDSAAQRTAHQDDGLQADERAITADLAEEKAQKKARDVLLTESAHILGDELGLIKADPRLAVLALPAAAKH